MTATWWRTREEEAPDPPTRPPITWLWSTPRSGAGLLLNLLSHPLRPDPSAALGFGPPPSAATSSPGVLPIDEFCLGAHLAPWPGDIVEAGERLVPGTVLSFNEVRPPYLLSKAAAASWHEPLRELVYARVDHARTLATSHVRDLEGDIPAVIKETTSAYAADRVTELMPESKAIVVIRDPRDIAASFLTEPDTFEEVGSVSDIGERRKIVIEAAEIWAMTVDGLRTALEGREDHKKLEVSFESLIERPERELKRARDLIGLDRDRPQMREAVAMDRYLNPIPGAESPPNDIRTPVGSWREVLSREESAEVERIAGSRLAACGYESS